MSERARSKFSTSASKARELNSAFTLLLASLLPEKFAVSDAELEWAYGQVTTMLGLIRANNGYILEQVDHGEP